MKNKEIVGIDVSKNTLDVFILRSGYHFTVENSPEGFAHLIETTREHVLHASHPLFFCFENTGRYSRLLSVFLEDAGFGFALLDALDLKRSMGLTRGKSDKKGVPGMRSPVPTSQALLWTSFGICLLFAIS